MNHIPVLLEEVLHFIDVDKGTKFIDGTAGSGGYVKAILNRNQKSKVLAIDLDRDALRILKQEISEMGLADRAVIVAGNYKDIDKLAEESDFIGASAVILDLGFSSFQLDDEGRGFSFQTSGPLDMRYDQSQKLTASEVINKYPEKQLEKIFREYGEEKFSKKIARKIVDQRSKSVIISTAEVLELVKESLPKPLRYKSSDHARRIFQAIRIEVNDELNNLEQALPKIFEILDSGGRMVITSFHSLEDRIVKNYFKELATGCTCPPEFPVCICQKTPKAKILTKKPTIATPDEIVVNPRSKSAKLRAIEKIS